MKTINLPISISVLKEASNISRTTLYEYMKDPVFRSKIEDIKQAFYTDLEILCNDKMETVLRKRISKLTKQKPYKKQ
jgi:hypothetical protein